MVHSVLTDKLRDYLNGNHEELAGSTIRGAPEAIRNRTKAGVADLSLMFEKFDKEERRKLTDIDSDSDEILHPDANSIKDAKMQQGPTTVGEVETEAIRELSDFRNDLVTTVSFALLCADDMGILPEKFLERALLLYMSKIQEEKPLLEDVEISIDIEREFNDFSDMDEEMRRDITNRTGVSASVMQGLIEDEKLSGEELQDLLE